MGRCTIPEKVFRIQAYGTCIRLDPRFRQAVLTRQVVFMQLVVDATGSNPEQLGRMRLIPMRPVQGSLEQ